MPSTAVGMLAQVELGQPTSYLVLAKGTAVYSADDVQIGKVTHVLAVEDEDLFEGIVIGEHLFGAEHRFVDVEDINGIYEHGVVLELDRSACEQLPKPEANPAVMRDDPAASQADLRRARLRRAWDRISGGR